MAMLKQKLKLVPITDLKEKKMKAASDEVNRQRKSPLQMERMIEIKAKKGYH